MSRPPVTVSAARAGQSGDALRGGPPGDRPRGEQLGGGPRAEQRDDGAGQAIVDPWTRWGWLFGGVWLFFWLFPLSTIWTTDWGLGHRLLSTALILLYVVVYIWTVRVAIRRVSAQDYRRAARGGLTGMTVLIVIVVALAFLINTGALTGLPFLVGMSVFFLPWRGVWTVSLSLLAVGVVASWWAWGWWPPAMLWGISVLVLGMSAVSRYVEERQEANQEAVSRLALVEERERVARDVHDVLGHSLTVVSMKTELARRLVDADPERAKAELVEVEDLSRQALAEIRATVGGLRIARLADEVEAARVALAGAGIEADLPEDLTVVDPRHRITLAWVLREAVTNVVRHSRATRCAVELAAEQLVVTDDGRGMAGREGNGLRGLRERVDQAGGTLTLGPGPDGTGTRLEVHL